MRVWLDTEFNGFGGELLSIGMISESGEYFYAWFDIGFQNCVPWVQENVYPHFSTPLEGGDPFEPEGVIPAKHRLENYLMRKGENVEIIADWPEDIQHLSNFMITGPGMMINTPKVMRFTIDRTINGASYLPHHALYDAIANMELSLTRSLTT